VKVENPNKPARFRKWKLIFKESGRYRASKLDKNTEGVNNHYKKSLMPVKGISDWYLNTI
jgi:hypothetical protein